MLIRSQNKERLMAFGNGCILHVLPGDSEYMIVFCIGAEDNCMSMGKYGTAERCIEVLDDIQTAYNYLQCAYSAASKNLDGAIYQMPEE